jgi:hypothetical protein
MVKIDAISEYTAFTMPQRSRLTAYVANVMAGIRDGGEMHARYQALARLSNTDLARRGLTRDTITRAVLSGGGV